MGKKYLILANSVTGKGASFKKNDTVVGSRFVDGTIEDLIATGAIKEVVEPTAKEKPTKNEQK